MIYHLHTRPNVILAAVGLSPVCVLVDLFVLRLNKIVTNDVLFHILSFCFLGNVWGLVYNTNETVVCDSVGLFDRVIALRFFESM